MRSLPRPRYEAMVILEGEGSIVDGRLWIASAFSAEASAPIAGLFRARVEGSWHH